MIDKSDPEKPCFVGAVMDIPWYFMDYYLYCPNSYQAIDVYKPIPYYDEDKLNINYFKERGILK